MAFAVLGPDVLAAGGKHRPDWGDPADRCRGWAHSLVPGLVAIVAYNCVVTTALGYFLWGRVLSMMPTTTAGQVLTLTPIGGFGLSLLVFGGTLFGESR
jgi:drug/metabolite transporter (DMT)-like permease